MSLGISLSAALTGLAANARAASMVSSNIANANTPGYGVRSVEMSSLTVAGQGTGVKVSNTNRAENPVLLQDRRFAEADAGEALELADFARTMERAIGQPGEAGSVSSLLTGLEQSLVDAAANPESNVRLGAVVSAGHAVANKINTVAADLTERRQTVDQEIGRTVDALNAALDQIVDLNTRIRRGGAASRDVASLIDARQNLIDQVAREIPLRELDRGRGEVALMGIGGVMLLDGKPAKLSFTPRTLITPEMTVESGALSRLEVNGNPLNVNSSLRPLRGGRLEALFTIRDIEAPKAQARLDAYSRDLVERFQDPAVDPTLAVGEAGLFTDEGAAFDTANELGLANRLALNAAVDPTRGGALWRLRDGINALTPGPMGDSQQIDRLAQALSSSRVAGSGDFAYAARSAGGLAADFLSIFSSERATAENREAFTSTQVSALREEELQRGVDTDAELQRLLLIEQAYAANAKVIATVGELLDLLERII